MIRPTKIRIEVSYDGYPAKFLEQAIGPDDEIEAMVVAAGDAAERLLVAVPQLHELPHSVKAVLDGANGAQP